MQTGFTDIDDNTYYFKEDGTMVKGLYRIEDDYYYLMTMENKLRINLRKFHEQKRPDIIF